MSTKPHVYRPGDKVRIVNPKFVRRVGYPLVWYEIDEALLDNDEQSARIANAMGWPEPSKLPRFALQVVAKLYVLERRFGGNERTIHYWPDTGAPPNVFDTLAWGRYYAAGTEHKIISRRLAKTGRRFPAYGRDDDWEPGGLDDCKTHVLLRLSGEVEIEACNVEPCA